MSRILRASLLAALIALASAVPASAQSPGGLVINEIDYDQPSTDTAEYLEIRNNGAASVNLDLFTLRFVNGSGGAFYLTVDLPAVDLAPGGYFVVCGDPTTVSECDLDAGATVDLIQNGAPDAVVLLSGDTIVDTVSYEGQVPDYTEGTAGAPADSGTEPGSLSRVPDGCDTDNNALDLTFVAATPGASNAAGSCDGIEGLRIHDIQGSSHVSPHSGAIVAGVPGVVTARRTNGYFVQDPRPDRDARTSEGIFVFTGNPPEFPPPDPALVPGTAVTLSGRVTEFRAGAANLSTTQISGATAEKLGSGTMIAPTLIGRGGRVPPGEVVEDDTVDPGGEDPPRVSGDVEVGDPLFDPNEDGLDFYESLEGMLAEVRNAVAVAPTTDFGSNRELVVLADNGAGASVRASRGPIVVRGFDSSAPQEFRRGDFNPERITLNDANDPSGNPVLPLNVNVRDRFTAPVRAVVDYSFGNYKFLALNNPPLADGRLQPEQTRKRDRDELAVASYNVENLDGLDSEERYKRVAQQIVGNLRSPDILSLEEIQDNDGAVSAAPTGADVTHALLIKAIQDAGGPRYDYRQINPVPGADGGEPGGNIRVSFLFRTDVRDLRFVDRPGGDATTPTRPAPGPGGAQLTLSPGRVDPTNSVWASSRKPLAGEFRYRGRPLFVVGNHFNSKGGDDPTFGRFQEPRRTSELQRRGSATDPADTTRGQAGVVNRFVRDILDIDRRALVIVLGDLNDFDFSETLRVVEQGPSTRSSPELVNLWRLLPRSERYSYIFQGNAQTLDHILVSPALLFAGRPDLDVVHMNTEFNDQASDHDPPITRLELDD
ncbi:MAG TPA: lamin tail domain-containing protein [Solirubrobacteraceae bacterium]|nr:lamin tail domain-containing protein [Solirubrobacteraceae bacterium]